MWSKVAAFWNEHKPIDRKKMEHEINLASVRQVNEIHVKHNLNLYEHLLSLYEAGQIQEIGKTKEGYSTIKELWRTSPFFIRYEFPFFVIRVKDDGIQTESTWNVSDDQRKVITALVWSETGRFLDINEYTEIAPKA